MVEDNKWSQKGFSFLKESLGQTVERLVEGKNIHLFIHSNRYLHRWQRGIGRHHPFKLGKREKEGKGTLSIIGGERRHPHNWKSFDGNNSLLFAVEYVFSIHFFTVFSYCLWGSWGKNTEMVAIPFSSGPCFVRTLHPSILGGPAQHGS